MPGISYLSYFSGRKTMHLHRDFKSNYVTNLIANISIGIWAFPDSQADCQKRAKVTGLYKLHKNKAFPYSLGISVIVFIKGN